MPSSSSGNGDGRNDSSLDGIAAVFVILVAIVLFPISLVMLGREIFGISASQAGGTAATAPASDRPGVMVLW